MSDTEYSVEGDLDFGGGCLSKGPSDTECLKYARSILSDAWRIASEENPDINFNAGNFYDLIREGVEAKKKLAEGKRQIDKYLTEHIEESVVQFDVTMKAVNDAVESCAKIAEQYDDRVCCDGGCGGNIAELMRSVK